MTVRNIRYNDADNSDPVVNFVHREYKVAVYGAATDATTEHTAPVGPTEVKWNVRITHQTFLTGNCSDVCHDNVMVFGNFYH